jgi:hypothetical protein
MQARPPRISHDPRCGSCAGTALATLKAAEMNPHQQKKESSMPLGTILLIVLVLLVLGALPTWPYSSGWGYYPSGGLGLVLVIILILFLLGRI